MADETTQRNYKRVGDATKCPACGWRMDPEAYRCPKCFIYFCFKCRARVTEREAQFQCADQACACYGKLLCAGCTIMVPEFQSFTFTVIDEPRRAIQEGDNWGWVALILPIAFGIALWWKYSIWWGVGCGLAVFVLVTVFLIWGGSTWFSSEQTIPPKQRSVTESRKVADHRCCIQCRHPAKVLR